MKRLLLSFLIISNAFVSCDEHKREFSRFVLDRIFESEPKEQKRILAAFFGITVKNLEEGNYEELSKLVQGVYQSSQENKTLLALNSGINYLNNFQLQRHDRETMESWDLGRIFT